MWEAFVWRVIELQASERSEIIGQLTIQESRQFISREKDDFYEFLWDCERSAMQKSLLSTAATRVWVTVKTVYILYCHFDSKDGTHCCAIFSLMTLYKLVLVQKYWQNMNKWHVNWSQVHIKDIYNVTRKISISNECCYLSVHLSIKCMTNKTHRGFHKNIYFKCNSAQNQLLTQRLNSAELIWIQLISTQPSITQSTEFSPAQLHMIELNSDVDKSIYKMN